MDLSPACTCEKSDPLQGWGLLPRVQSFLKAQHALFSIPRLFSGQSSLADFNRYLNVLDPWIPFEISSPGLRFETKNIYYSHCSLWNNPSSLEGISSTSIGDFQNRKNCINPRGQPWNSSTWGLARHRDQNPRGPGPLPSLTGILWCPNDTRHRMTEAQS